ncbi:MAG: sigma-70 family RNA polymerase sigma factor [Bacteroidota bacterium]
MQNPSISISRQDQTTAIWNTWRDNLFGFILKRVKDPVIAEDILQESFIKIHLKLHQLKSNAKLEAWVFQIARNQVNDYFYQQKRQQEMVDNSWEIQEIDASEQHQEEWLCCFDPFLNALPGKYRIVIDPIHREGKKQKEVAEELGISLANVKSRVHRAKELLKEHFMQCCKFTQNEEGKLIGEQHCERCETYSKD